MHYDYDATLTAAEFATFSPNAEVVRYLEQTRQRLRLEKKDMNVLDWGSGRGEYVTWLRDAGYNAFGAEIFMQAAARGADVLRAHGHDSHRVIRPIAPDGKTDLPAGFFHFVFTHYVLEHVADIDAVTAEIARVTASGGSGFHVYPGKLRPIEPHLFMPFIHWLPKSLLRKWAIWSFVSCGIEPRWNWLNGADVRKKTQAYYNYCINETFYRTFRRVRRSFNRVGFEVTPVAADHPALRRLHVLPGAVRQLLVGIPVTLFQTAEIVVRKAPASANPAAR
jgi:SAM-dependent methyltransferase